MPEITYTSDTLFSKSVSLYAHMHVHVRQRERGYLQVPHGEDDGVRQVHLVGVLVDGGRDDR